MFVDARVFEAAVAIVRDLPEDLSLVRSNGEALMFGISHEREGGLALYPEERSRLLSACPGLGECIQWHEPRLS